MHIGDSHLKFLYLYHSPFLRFFLVKTLLYCHNMNKIHNFHSLQDNLYIYKKETKNMILQTNNGCRLLDAFFYFDFDFESGAKRTIFL